MTAGVIYYSDYLFSMKKNNLKNPGAKTISKDDSTQMSQIGLSYERYQTFIDNISEGIYETDIHGNFIYFNNSLCKVFGYPREEIQFESFAKFMDEEYSKKAFDTFTRIFQTGQGISDLVWKVYDKNGALNIIELSANLIIDKDGKKVGFRGIARDITDKFRSQEALRKSDRRYKNFLDFVPYPIVLFTVDGRVSFLNPAFTEIFGWTFEELKGQVIPYVPPGLEKETSENIKKLFEQKIILRYETQRLTKDGRILDVIFRAAVYSEIGNDPSGELVILRDITQEKRHERVNEALLRISMALPEYPDLEELLDYISGEIKSLLGSEGAQVLLLDEEKKELFYLGAAYDDIATEKKIKKIRYPASKGVSGRVIRTGKPIIIPDVNKDPSFYSIVDTLSGIKTRNLLNVPLRSKDRIIGVLSAKNKISGSFDETDIELLNMIAGTVALSIENARYSEDLRKAYEEVTSLNRAKDKVINHLSHELKTPLAVLGASLNILEKRLSSLPRQTWKPTIERAQRNVDRVLEMQYEVEDIIRDKRYETRNVLSMLLDECADELVSLVAEEVGEGQIVEKIRKRINEIFGAKENPSQEILLDKFIPEIIDETRPFFSHRHVELITEFETVPAVNMPVDILRKVVVGLIKNAIENTPDEGKIEVFVRKKKEGIELSVKDYGVGITPNDQKRIFEGFFVTQETIDYSSKRPFDFNAGGKGADLLRMKIFSGRHNFKINMVSSRCKYMCSYKDICPGRITKCKHCKKKEDCHQSGGTAFTVFSPLVSDNSTSLETQEAAP